MCLHALADAPEFQSWRISCENLLSRSCIGCAGRLRRHCFRSPAQQQRDPGFYPGRLFVKLIRFGIVVWRLNVLSGFKYYDHFNVLEFAVLAIINNLNFVYHGKHEQSSASRYNPRQSANQQRMDWLRTLAALVWHLLVVLCQRAADHVVQRSGGRFAFAER
jgi:hypothetical protein